MAKQRNIIAILGCGPGSADFLTPAVTRGVKESEVLIGAQRLLDMFPRSRAKKIPVAAVECALDQIRSARKAGRRVAVLVSGDPGICSLTRFVVGRFGREHCRIIPGISSVQMAFARIGMEWHNARIISAHAQVPDIVMANLKMNDQIAVLTGHSGGREWIKRLISSAGKTHRIFWCESLSLPQEHVEEVVVNSGWRLPENTMGILVLVRRDCLSVIPAKAGIQDQAKNMLDSHFHGNDKPLLRKVRKS